jgi:hypothetical protein
MLFMKQRKGPHSSDDGIEWVCCRICGNHHRVISGRHLSKHDTDRDTYMEEYHLSPDELIAKAFRVTKFSPWLSSEWEKRMDRCRQQGVQRDGKVFAGHLQAKHPHLCDQSIWIVGDLGKVLLAAGFDPRKCGCAGFGIKMKS